MDGLVQVKVPIGAQSLKREDLRMLSFGSKDWGFLLLGNKVSCLCLVGGEWCIDSAYEGCNQAQSHADIRGEPSDSCLPESVFLVRAEWL